MNTAGVLELRVSRVGDLTDWELESMLQILGGD